MIFDKPRAGVYNMAVDEAIFLTYPFIKIPTLRIYGWNPPCVSLGYNQKAGRVLNSKTTFPFVRRITGGASILHNKEVTYSLSCSLSDLDISRKVKESYKQLCSFVINFYAQLGLKAGFAGEAGYFIPQKYGNFCFSTAEQYDIMINGKKAGGNAQRRRKDFIFQQGSIPQEINFEMIEKVINTSLPVKNTTAGLNDFLNKDTDFNHLGNILADCFKHTFGVDLQGGELLNEEKQIRDSLMIKYASKAWNFKNE